MPKKKGKAGLLIVVAVILLLGGVAAAGLLLWSPWTSSASGEVSPVCQQALVCCKQVMQAQTNDPTKVTMCDGLSSLPDKTCAEWGDKYRTTAKALNISCP